MPKHIYITELPSERMGSHCLVNLIETKNRIKVRIK